MVASITARTLKPRTLDIAQFLRSLNEKRKNKMSSVHSSSVYTVITTAVVRVFWVK